MLGQFVSEQDPFLVRAQLGQFPFEFLLLAGLDCEVGLGGGDFGVTGIAVHGDEEAGMAGEEVVLELALSATAQGDHFIDINKMVLYPISGAFTSQFGFA
jgi:hypothetical protein